MMKSAIIALMLLVPVVSQAASLEDNYIAARDRYIAKLSVKKLPASVQKQEDSFYADLAKQLRQIIGPTPIKGFPANGKNNIETLYNSDQGFGMLDGLVFASGDGKTRIVVTNDVLFAKWLRQHRNWWPKLENVPQKAEEALKSETFFTQALQGDAAVSTYGILPIKKPEGAKFAYATLVGRSQDIGPLVPDEIIVSVIQGPKIFVVSAPTGFEIKVVAACDEIWKASEKKASALQEAWSATERKNEKIYDAYSKAQQDGSDAFRACMFQHIAKADFLPTLTAQAQALADLLPAK
jgi:hypothetical protein